ncbi:replication initiator protein A [uncultured Rhodoblastus sp.]|uniref:replication initiator protein A n=1 Tax=uncultured Rhodoblastus sp. TaxID=543037 RepID=UPI0025F057D8|nr:replication initiator protein A [uncultured Rhodoblastus sp.]
MAKKIPSDAEQTGAKLYIESTLLRIAGALFCHDAKRAPLQTQEIELNRGSMEKHISIRPDPKLGQPGPLAHKIFVALIKKHSDYGRPVAKEIHFTRREIGRLIGRKHWGGRDSEQLARALHEIHYTFVKTHFKTAGGAFAEHSFSVFPEILIERREFASDPIEACTITLAQPIISSLVDEHFTCLNHSMMQDFGTIGQALYMRTFFHFANLYNGVNGSQLSLQKRYDDICRDWLGGLSVHRQKSTIVRNQLGPHLDKLVAAGFLASFDLEKAKRDSGFVVTFRPGHAFFDDFDRFYRRGARTTSPAVTSSQETKEPLRFAYLFAEKRTGLPVSSIAYVNSKDVETARQMLTEISIEDAAAFVDFALAAAKNTNFDVQTLGGLRQYLALFKSRQTSEISIREKTADWQRVETLKNAYESYRRQEAEALFATLPAEERQAIDQLARSSANGYRGSLQEAMTDTKRRQITIERYGYRIKSAEEWASLAQAS